MGEKLASDIKEPHHDEIEREDGDWKHFLFDPENKTVLGRTASSWVSVTAFYAVYYTLIAILSYYTVMGYQSRMVVYPDDPKAHPTTQTRVSTPGVATFPGVEQIIIDANRVSGFGYIDKINNRMSAWMKDASESDKEVLNQLGACSPICAENALDADGSCANPPLRQSYDAGSPCVYYQINKVMNWKPFPYMSLNDEHVSPRSSDPSKSLVGEAVEDFDNSNVYLYCYDLDLVRGFVNETDRFTATYYSTDDSSSASGKNYGTYKFSNWPILEGAAIKAKRNPVVAVKIDINEKYHNTLVNVACQAYAANLGPNEQINEAFAVMPITVMAAGESTIAKINEEYRN